ncbi:MAG: type IV pilus modification protein PilV [Cocleimonas sp.]|nr:type IV pilus modification protein PilV [Cocleimonas sp.]
MKLSSFKHQLGVSLIESMMATLVISIGLLGVVGMQIVAMKGSTHAFQQAQASGLMKGLLERMRSNAQAVFDDDYSILDSSNYNCSVTLSKNCENGMASCSSEELAKSDLYHTICGYDAAHLGGIRGSLGNGSIQIACSAGVGTCNEGINFSVNWDERVLGKEGDGKSALPRSISLNTVISP